MSRLAGFAILSIGDELLAGRTVNTNAAWLGNAILSRGGRVLLSVTVPDDRAQIRSKLLELCDAADYVIVTGGLGPTDDDLTRDVVCELLGTDLVHSPEQQELIEDRFRRLGRELNRRTLDQAMVPEGTEVLLNHEGTAPGMIATIEGTQVFFLPGVPYEMEALFEEGVARKLRFDGATIERNWLTAGIPESELAIHLEPVEEQFGEGIKLAYLPSSGVIRLRLTAEGEPQSIRQAFDEAVASIEEVIREWIISNRSERIEELVGRQLGSLGATLAVAESCTGGRLGGRITTVPGSGGWFQGGVISYNNRIKNDLLHVSRETLGAYGAVSEETAREMALGALDAFDADYSVAITGIAGPDGGTPEKPVGTVCISVAARDHDGDDPTVTVTSHYFRGNRESVRTRSVITALLQLSRRLQMDGAEGGLG